MKLITPFLSLFLLASCLEADDKAPAATEKAAPAAAADAKGPHPAMKDPSKAVEKAPDSFEVAFETTKGPFEVKVNREWSPLGADRFYNLVKIGYFQDIAFFRVLDGFMAQFGVHGDPDVNAVWKDANINDDGKAVVSNTPGRITFAKTGAPNSRSVQFFINYGANANLDGMGFTPFGEVTKGMEVVKSLYSGYGEGAPRGRGPDQQQLQMQGNPFLKKSFPKLDYIKSAKLK